RGKPRPRREAVLARDEELRVGQFDRRIAPALRPEFVPVSFDPLGVAIDVLPHGSRDPSAFEPRDCLGPATGKGSNRRGILRLGGVEKILGEFPVLPGRSLEKLIVPRAPVPSGTVQPMQSDVADLAIVGGGAAGLAAAIFAAEVAPSGVRIVVLDGAKTLGAKILVSGGGRCNVTHHEVLAKDFNGSQHIVRNILSAFDVAATVDWFASLGV